MIVTDNSEVVYAFGLEAGEWFDSGEYTDNSVFHSLGSVDGSPVILKRGNFGARQDVVVAEIYDYSSGVQFKVADMLGEQLGKNVYPLGMVVWL